ncbi:unnamed protein product, partial [Calicophoron daubneyi]
VLKRSTYALSNVDFVDFLFTHGLTAKLSSPVTESTRSDRLCGGQTHSGCGPAEWNFAELPPDAPDVVLLDVGHNKASKHKQDITMHTGERQYSKQARALLYRRKPSLPNMRLYCTRRKAVKMSFNGGRELSLDAHK